MISIAKKIAFSGLRALNAVVPKKRGRLIFISDPDYGGNAKALFEHIRKNEGGKYDLVWLVNDTALQERLKKDGVQARLIRSVSGIWALFRSRMVLTTHGQLGRLKAGRQIHAFLEHGVPFKAGGFTYKAGDKEYYSNLSMDFKRCDFCVSTSEMMRCVESAMYGLDSRKVHVTGLPQNDALFSGGSRELLSNVLGRDVSNYTKIILFAPTFRKWSNSKNDGTAPKQNIFGFFDYDAEKLDSFLKSENALLLVKLHPYEDKNTDYSSQILPENSAVVKDEMLNRKIIGLFDLLASIDLLITDYSSIFFQFLLLDRPLLFATADIVEYSDSRGFLLEPYEFWTPGPKAKDFKSFLNELRRCIKEPEYYSDERKTINSIVNKYLDGKSCERVWDALKKML